MGEYEDWLERELEWGIADKLARASNEAKDKANAVAIRRKPKPVLKVVEDHPSAHGDYHQPDPRKKDRT